VAEINLAVEIYFEGDGTDDHFEAFLEAVLAQLDNIGREVNLAARIADRTADIDVCVIADDFEEAAYQFLVDVRTALHAAGCATHGWPTFKPSRRVVRELEREFQAA
jgi:hypothetical protein